MNTDREKRQWWAVADDDVTLVDGYSCAPNNPEMWWCPEVGFSGMEGGHLFKTEIEAINRLLDELNKRIEVAYDNIQSLQLRKRLLTSAPAAPRG